MPIRSLLLIAVVAFSFRSTAQTIENTEWNIYEGTMLVTTGLFENGTFYVFLGTFEPLATYTISGNTISITDISSEPCSGAVGSYNFSIVSDTLHFTLISDPCDDRSLVFLEYHWVSSNSTNIMSNTLSLDLKIYPNPSDGDIYITRTSPGPLEIHVYTILGELVHTERSNGINERIELDHLTPGTYLVHARTETDGVTERIVIE